MHGIDFEKRWFLIMAYVFNQHVIKVINQNIFFSQIFKIRRETGKLPLGKNKLKRIKFEIDILDVVGIIHLVYSPTSACTSNPIPLSGIIFEIFLRLEGCSS